MSTHSQPGLYTYRAFVSNVYDGDTVTLDIDLGFDISLKGQKVRLLHISAPELRGESRPSGLMSRDALRARIANKWVVLRTERDRKEKFGRWLGEIWLEGECVNSWMLAEGHAKEYGKKT